MKDKKHKREETDGYQQWPITVLNQNVVSVGSTSYGISLAQFIDENPDFEITICSPTAKYISNATMLTDSVPIVLSTNGTVNGVIIIAGHRKPPCS